MITIVSPEKSNQIVLINPLLQIKTRDNDFVNFVISILISSILMDVDLKEGI